MLVKNFIQPGQYGLTVIAPAGGVTAGQVVIVGAIVGVAACNAAAGAEVEISPEGVFDIGKVPADALAQGAVAKVTPATGLVGLAGTAAIGWVVAAAASGASTARVRLTPAVAGTPTVMETAPEHNAAQHAARRGRE
jgi:predicted RecA/RadA family phage recombinase